MDTLTDENSISSTSEREFYGCMMNLCQWFESKIHTVGSQLQNFNRQCRRIIAHCPPKKH